ncbi:hypothetical protein [Gordonia sp. FQ]|uniref:hypothetical protein n=1 Tax=Gordonia sp. FQ TaxID=3446634 RepID=UPI003F859FF8
MTPTEQKVRKARRLIAAGMTRQDAATRVGVSRETLRVYLDGAACRFPGCTKLARNRGLCSGHIQQERRGEDLHPLSATKANTMISIEDAELDVHEFEFMRHICGLSPVQAVVRLGMSPYVIIDRYHRLGREVPVELAAIRSVRLATARRMVDPMAAAS